MKAKSIAAVCAAALLVACAPLQQTTAASATLTQEVTAFLADYLAAIGARDAAKIRTACVADERFVWIEDGKVRYRKADEVIASLAMFPSGSAIRTEVKDLTIVRVGQSAAHAWGTFRTSVGDGPSGFAFGGAISFTLEREGASWKIVGGHTSSPRRP